ncbi:MAG: glycosyltransferase [Methanolobus sp.]|nr:glycosyltransferase [Methanolobus sp.]
MLVTNPCINDARVLKEATSLSKDGHELVVWAVSKNGIPTFQQKDGFSIKRISKKMKENSLLGKLEHSPKFIYHSIKENADVYHAHDLSTLLECYIASRWNRSKVIYDSHELFIRNYNNKNNYMNIYYYLEHFLIKKVDSIITVNDFIAEELQQRYNLKKEIVVLMNCPALEDENDDDNNCSNDDILKNKAAGKQIIIYQGVMQKGRGLIQLVESMKYLDDNYFLLMVGDGPLKNKIEEVAKEEDIKNIYFTGLVNFTHLFEYTKMANLGVILFENNSLNNYYASPNKLFEYIHCNLPILAPNYPFISSIVQKYNIGMLIDEIEPKKIADAIKNILSDQDRYFFMKSNTDVAKKDLNWENEEKKLLELYRKE